MAKKAQATVAPVVATEEHETYQTTGPWARDWEEFGNKDHINYGSFPKDAIWKSHKALFYDQYEGKWSPKKVSDCFIVGGDDNSSNWLASNPDFYRDLALYHKDNRNYDLTNVMHIGQLEDLNDLTKEELQKLWVFIYFCEDDELSSPEDVCLVDYKTTEAIRRRYTKKRLAEEIYQEFCEYWASTSDLPDNFKIWANEQLEYVDDAKSDDSQYDFLTEEGRREFVEDCREAGQLDYSDIACDYAYQKRSGIYRIKNADTFQGTLVKLWKEGIRLIPMIEDFLIKWERSGVEAEYFQFRKWEGSSVEYDYKLWGGRYGIDEHVENMVDIWVESKQYLVDCLPTDQSQTCPTGYCDFHGELVQLFISGFCVVPVEIKQKGTMNRVMELKFLNYHGAEDEFYQYKS